MLGATHMLAGAAFYRQMENRVLAYGLAFGSHFLLDAVPHYELSYNWNRILVVGAGLFLVVLARQDWRILLAAFLALLPDLIWEYGLSGSFAQIHNSLHTPWNGPFYLFFFESLLLALFLGLILAPRREKLN